MRTKVPQNFSNLPEKTLDFFVGICYDHSVMVNNNNNDSAPSDVYILHFKQPYWNNAQHYVGYTTIGAQERITLHRKGKGSLLVRYAHQTLGIDFAVGLIEQFATRKLARWRELQLKKEKHLSRHCEICNGHRQASNT